MNLFLRRFFHLADCKPFFRSKRKSKVEKRKKNLIHSHSLFLSPAEFFFYWEIFFLYSFSLLILRFSSFSKEFLVYRREMKPIHINLSLEKYLQFVSNFISHFCRSKTLNIVAKLILTKLETSCMNFYKL